MRSFQVACERCSARWSCSIVHVHVRELSVWSPLVAVGRRVSRAVAPVATLSSLGDVTAFMTHGWLERVGMPEVCIEHRPHPAHLDVISEISAAGLMVGCEPMCVCVVDDSASVGIRWRALLRRAPTHRGHATQAENCVTPRLFDRGAEDGCGGCDAEGWLRGQNEGAFSAGSTAPQRAGVSGGWPEHQPETTYGYEHVGRPRRLDAGVRLHEPWILKAGLRGDVCHVWLWGLL